SGPAVMAKGPLSAIGRSNSVICPFVVIRPIRFSRCSVNHRLPSGPAAIPVGLALLSGSGDSTISPGAGAWPIPDSVALATKVTSRTALVTRTDPPRLQVPRCRHRQHGEDQEGQGGDRSSAGLELESLNLGHALGRGRGARRGELRGQPHHPLHR